MFVCSYQLIWRETEAWPHPGSLEVASNPGLAWPQDLSSSLAPSHLAALCRYEGSKEMTGKHHHSPTLHA